MNDHLKRLLDTARNSETPAGQQRIDELADQLRTPETDLDGMSSASLTEFEQIYNGGDFQPEQADSLYALADIADAVHTVRSEQQAAEQQANEVSDLADRVRSTHTPAEQDSEGTTPNEQPAEQPEFPDEPEPTPDDEPSETEQADERVAASGNQRPNTAAAVKNAQPTDPAPTTAPTAPSRSLSITAAADVPDVPHRKRLDMGEAGQALVSCLRDMPPDGAPAPSGKKGIVNLHREFDSSLLASGDDNPAEADQLLDRISDETRLPGGSLVAAAKQQNDAVIAAGPTLGTPPGDIWCSPSTQDYSLCPALASGTVGTWDGPTFSVRRGGIRYTTWPQYPEQHRPVEHREVGADSTEKDNDQNQGWPQDPQGVANDDDLTSQPPRHDWHGYVIPYDHGLTDPDHFLKEPKKFIEGPCPEWREQRMNLSYMWVRADRLRDHTYPEVGQRFLSDALVSHRRFMNETYIRWIYHHSDRLADFDASTPSQFGPSGTIPPGPASPPGPSYPGRHDAPQSWYETTNQFWPGGPKDTSSLATFALGSASEAILERLGLLVTWFRNTYRTSYGYSLEGFAPYWLKEFLKLDLERKSNRPHNLPVGDAEVDAVFAQWGVRMQWLYDFQDMPSTETGGDRIQDRRVMPPQGWPNACDIVLYPAGAWALAQDQILRISGEQGANPMDTREMRTNKYTRLFMEDSWMLINKCQRSFVVRLTNLCSNGAVGAQRDACSVGTTVSSVAVTGDANVETGKSGKVTATATMSDNSTRDVTRSAVWKSSDDTVATVGTDGTVTGVAAGSANITATSGGVTSENHAVTVKDPAPQSQGGDDSGKSSGSRKTS